MIGPFLLFDTTTSAIAMAVVMMMAMVVRIMMLMWKDDNIFAFGFQFKNGFRIVIGHDYQIGFTTNATFFPGFVAIFLE